MSSLPCPVRSRQEGFKTPSAFHISQSMTIVRGASSNRRERRALVRSIDAEDRPILLQATRMQTNPYLQGPSDESIGIRERHVCLRLRTTQQSLA